MTNQSSNLKNVGLRLGVILAACLIGLWGWSQWQTYTQLADWEAARSTGTRTLMELEAVPDVPQAYIDFGRAYSREVFPPEHRRALAAFEEAIRLDPLDSTPWFELAQEQVLTGRKDLALQSLERSDALDPSFPRQRFGSIHLWSMLGQPERGRKAAKRLAQLGGSLRKESIRSLQGIGLPPAEIYEFLELQNVNPRDRANSLGVLHTKDQLAMEQLFRLVSFADCDDAQTLSQVIRLASDPMVFSFVSDVWSQRYGSLGQSPSILLRNADLTRAPFDEEAFLGWQPPIGKPVTDRWVSPSPAIAQPRGYLQLEFNKPAPIVWQAHRFAVAPQTQLDLRIDVRTRPIAVWNLRVIARSGDHVVNAVASAETDQWQTLKLELPPTLNGELVTLMINARPLPEAATLPAEINIGKLEVWPIEDGNKLDRPIENTSASQ